MKSNQHLYISSGFCVILFLSETIATTTTISTGAILPGVCVLLITNCKILIRKNFNLQLQNVPKKYFLMPALRKLEYRYYFFFINFISKNKQQSQMFETFQKPNEIRCQHTRQSERCVLTENDKEICMEKQIFAWFMRMNVRDCRTCSFYLVWQEENVIWVFRAVINF